MKTNALFVIESDPRQSGRAAEAVRIAAGVGAWKKVAVAVYLREAAVLALSDAAEDFPDGELFKQCLPMLAESPRTIFVQKGAKMLSGLGQATAAFQEMSDDQLAEMVASHACVLRF
jgi:hypothetical protein